MNITYNPYSKFTVTADGYTVSLDVDHLDFGANLVTSTDGYGLASVIQKRHNIVTVAPTGGEFSSVAAAINSILDASAINPYIVSIAPGVYVEPQIILKPYVYVKGDANGASILTPSNPSDHLIVAIGNTSVQDLTVTGVTGIGKAGIYFGALSSAPLVIDNLNFRANTICFLSEGIASTAITAIDNCSFTGVHNQAIVLRNNGFPAQISFKDSVVDSSTATGTAIEISGSGTQLSVDAIVCRGSLATDAVHCYDGAQFVGTGIIFSTYIKGLWIQNTGSAPSIDLWGLTLVNCTTDVQIDHPGTTGTLSGIIDEDKTILDSGTIGHIALLLLDPDGTLNLGGVIRARQPDNTFVDTSTLATQGVAVGLFSDGDVSPPISGFTVTVESGFGYLQKSDGSLKKVTWSSTPITLSANQESFIYFDSSGTLQNNVSTPDPVQNIVLARAVTDGYGILILEESGFLATHASSGIGIALRNGLGPVYASGSTVSELGTRTLNVTAGSYYFGERNFLANGGSPISFTSIYRDGYSGFIYTAGQTVVNNTVWDNGSGTLTPIMADGYARHSLYCLGDSSSDFDSEAYFLVYAQAQYTALTLAEQGSLPTPPPTFSDAVALIASIIVDPNNPHFVEILDERPLFASKRVSAISATTFHSNLLGLPIGDDHPQYWRNDGTHIATGDWNLGTHNISNAGTWNSVTVENHHARHQPGGADALPTAAPTSDLTATTTNAVGISTSFSRADHGHAIDTGAASTQTPDQSNATGTSANLARADHIHNIPTGTPSSIGTTNAQGSTAAFARQDHIHQGVHSVNANSGTQRYGDLTLQQGNGITIVDDGYGKFTIDTLDAANEFVVTTGSGLTANYTGGNVWFGTTFTQISAGSLSLTASQTNWFVYVDVDATVKNAAAVPPNAIPLAKFSTSGVAITSLVNVREQVNHDIIFGATGDIQTLNATNSASAGATNKHADAGHVHAITTGAASTQNPDQANATGSSASLARADHVHNIPTAAAATLDSTTTNTQGSSTSFARADHTHAITTAAATTQTPNQANAAGSAAGLAKADHVHNIPTATASGLNANSTNTQGAAASFAQSDHTHAIASGVVSTQTPNQTNAAGTSTNFARADHIHNVPTAAPANQTIAASASDGSAATFSRADHLHTFSTAAPVILTPNESNAQGSSTSFARADHVHNIPTGIASTISANSDTQGSSAAFAQQDHTHQLTASAASQDQVPQYDGSNWQGTYSEQLIVSARSIRLSDDWMSGTVASQLGWTAATAGGGSTIAAATTQVANNHPGVLKLTCGANANTSATINLSLNQFIAGGGAANMEWDIDIEALSTGVQTYTLRIGFGDSNTADFTNGIYFEYNTGTSANWITATASGGTRTKTTSSTAVATGWNRLTLQVNAAASSVTFLVNGTSIGTNTTNIPTSATGIVMQLLGVAGNATKSVDVDYFMLNQRFTSSR